MEDEISLQLEEAKEKMGKALEHTSNEMRKVRAGKAVPDMLYGIMVEYYNMDTPLEQLASINAPDARTLMVKPFDKSVIKNIEKAIVDSNLGLNPQNDGESIRINIPTLTEERRKELFKQVKNEAENGKISVRNIRKDVKEQLKKLQKEGMEEDAVKKAEEDVQNITDEYVNKIDKLLSDKEEELMNI